MKLFIKSSLIIFSLILMFGACMSNAQNTLTEKEKEDGWILLFNGETTDGWRSYNSEDFPDKGWEVKEGNLKVLPQGGGGDIITQKKYANYALKLEWKVQKGGNSGIFYRAMEQPTQPIYWSAPEMQVLDNTNHPDAEKGENGNRKAGSLYDLIPAKPQNFKGHGEWNTAKIVAEGPHIEHWQNGEKVLEYELWTNEWYELIRQSKFQNHPEFGDARSGYIGLQDHGDQVSFRNIKIKELK